MKRGQAKQRDTAQRRREAERQLKAQRVEEMLRRNAPDYDAYKDIPLIEGYEPLPLDFLQQVLSSMTHQDVPHCIVCGDTQKQCPLLRFEGTKRCLCRTCYSIQTNM